MRNKEKSASAIGIIGGADGPTSIFLAGKKKETLKQKWQKTIFQYRKNKAGKSLKANPHTMQQVLEYVKEKWDCTEMPHDAWEYQEEYTQMRASFILQYKPELLGDLAEVPQMGEPTEENLKRFVDQMEQRQKLAQEIPVKEFDIDLHILEKREGNSKMRIILESNFDYIGGSMSGKKAQVKKFNKVFRDVYLYYGVAREDIENKTQRYEDLVRILARR